MLIRDLIRQYSFHDSLVEGMNLKGDELELQLELHNWQQETQKDEKMNIFLFFKNIKSFVFDATKEEFDCDSIVDFVAERYINDPWCNVKIVLDGDDNIKIIKFIGKEVEVRQVVNKSKN